MNSKIAYVALDFDGVLHHHCAGLKKTDQFNPITGVQLFKKMLEERFPRVSEDLDYFQPEGHLFDRTHHLENLPATAHGQDRTSDVMASEGLF